MKILQSTLSTRTAALLDCNGELEDLSQKLQGYLQDWCPRVHPTGYDSKYISVQDDFYVIACPELHALPAKDIFGGFVETIVEDERQEVRLSQTLTSARTISCLRHCPHCFPEKVALLLMLSERRTRPIILLWLALNRTSDVLNALGMLGSSRLGKSSRFRGYHLKFKDDCSHGSR